MARSRGIAARACAVLASEASARDGFVVDGDWIVRRTGTQTSNGSFRSSAVELTGRHMLNNVLAAAAAAHDRWRAAAAP